MEGGREKKSWAFPNLLRAVGVNPRMEQDFLVLTVKAQLHSPPSVNKMTHTFGQ